MSIYGYTLVPTKGNSITSITWQSQYTALSPNGIFVVTDSAGNNYVYTIPVDFNFEIGLNYSNSTGSYQVLTYNGLQNGVGMTSIIFAKTSDTFSAIIDSSRQFG